MNALRGYLVALFFTVAIALVAMGVGHSATTYQSGQAVSGTTSAGVAFQGFPVGVGGQDSQGLARTLLLSPSGGPGGGQPFNVTTVSSTAYLALVTGPGTVDNIDINTAASSGGVAIVYDGLTAAGTVLGTIDTATERDMPVHWRFATGLSVVTTTHEPDMTLTVY